MNGRLQILVTGGLLMIGALPFIATPSRAQDADAKKAVEKNSDEKKTDAEPAEKSTALLESAMERLNERVFRAKLRQTIFTTLGPSTPDKKVLATGLMVQGPGYRMRLELDLKVGGTEAKLTQVCDGEILWTLKTIGNEAPSLTRRDVQAIMRASTGNERSKSRLQMELGVGGLRGLLASINRTMDFAPPETETIDGEEFQVLTGSWKAEYLANFQPDPKKKVELPLQVPTNVKIYFDTNTFPRRIQYRKQIPNRNYSRPQLTLDLQDVELLTEEQLPAKTFELKKPKNVYEKDVTDQYLSIVKKQAAKK